MGNKLNREWRHPDRGRGSGTKVIPWLPRPRADTCKTPKSPQRRTKTQPDAAKSTLVTAADAPESVRRLLKSYDPRKLRWRVRNDRHEIVVTILTRGNAHAKRWLWTVLSRSEVRKLVREYQGAGCAEPDRVLLREQLDLTTTDIPTRPYLGFGT